MPKPTSFESLFSKKTIDVDNAVATLVNFPYQGTTLILEAINDMNNVVKNFYKIKMSDKHALIISEDLSERDTNENLFAGIKYYFKQYKLDRNELNDLLRQIDNKNIKTLKKEKREMSLIKNSFFNSEYSDVMQYKDVSELHLIYGYKVLRNILQSVTDENVPIGLEDFRNSAEYVAPNRSVENSL